MSDYGASIHPLPQRLVRTAQEILGENGDAWLARIPDIVQHCEVQWSCEFAPPFETLSYNFVAPGKRADGSDVVLKICIPGPDYATEAD
jgi:streptomycin 6-kinase